MEKFPKQTPEKIDLYEDIHDLVKVGSGMMTTHHRSDGKFLSKDELNMIRAHQDKIRGQEIDNVAPLPTPEYTDPQPTQFPTAKEIVEAVTKDQTNATHHEKAKILGKRAATKMAGFLDVDTSPEQLEKLKRAEYLQRRVDKLLHGIEKGSANHLGLDHELVSSSQEFTDIMRSESSAEIAENFSLTEGGMKLLERGLLCGKVPDAEDFPRLEKLIQHQKIKKVTHDIHGNPSILYVKKPRYLKDVEPGYGPYNSPEDDTVAHVMELIDESNWILSPEDVDYLHEALTYGPKKGLSRHKGPASPSGAEFFWNRPPFGIYIKQSIDEARETSSTEEERKKRMSNPTVRAKIDFSDTILDWWQASVGKSYVGSKPIDLTNHGKNLKRDETVIKDLQEYAAARLKLHSELNTV